MSSTENKVSLPLTDPRQADASYQPFPSFSEWFRCVVDTNRWDRYTSSVSNKGEISSTTLREARKVVERAAAVDTGAIEGLYDTDRGFTFTVAVQSAIWQAVVEEQKGAKVLAFIESQLNAYDFVLDFATQQVPIAEAWIRTLHAEICRNQDTYTAYTEIGVQELPLPRGEYKHLPNHVIRRDGKIHSHTPVDLTPAEMHRFCNELRSEAFTTAHPVLQASYAHYAFVLIHPFADGNGRVARALASAFTYRSNSIPLLILTENKNDYFKSLELADNGNYQPFVDFIFERGLDAVRLFEESIRAASSPNTEGTVEEIRKLYVTTGGYSQTDVDEAGYKLIELFGQEVKKRLENLTVKDVLNISSEVESAGWKPEDASYRTTVSRGSMRLNIRLFTFAPASASLTRYFNLEVPKDCGRDDDLVLRDMDSNERFEARMAELVPVPTAALQMRISMAVERIIGDALNKLLASANNSLKQ